jgi:hypothetical protein
MYLHYASKDTKCLNTMYLMVPSVPVGQLHSGTVTHVTPCIVCRPVSCWYSTAVSSTVPPSGGPSGAENSIALWLEKWHSRSLYECQDFARTDKLARHFHQSLSLWRIYFERNVTDQNYTHEEIRSRWNSATACSILYTSAQHLICCTESVRLNLSRLWFCLLSCMGVQLGLSQ